MNDRDGLRLCAVLMLITAMQGDDSDVALAAKGVNSDSMAYLYGKYGDQSLETVRILNAIIKPKQPSPKDVSERFLATNGGAA